MLVDGRAIATQVKDVLAQEIQKSGKKLSLAVVTASDDFATQQFTGIKKRVGEALGVSVVFDEHDVDVTTDELIAAVEKAANTHDGVIVQLPLPKSIDTEVVLGALPARVDVDVIGVEAREHITSDTVAIYPPVVAAIAEILRVHDVDVKEQQVLVVGQGKLVGAPAAAWCARHGAWVTAVNKNTTQDELARLAHGADVIILGAGSPGLLKPDMVKECAVVLDAGTSEVAGQVAGDADPAIAEKVKLLTPVPGGIGPIAVAMLFKNLLILADG